MADQEQAYYYVGGERIPLNLLPGVLAVTYRTPVAGEAARGLEPISNDAQPAASFGRSPALTERNMVVVETAAGVAERGLGAAAPQPPLHERLRQNPDVQHVTQVFRSASSDLYVILTDEILVRFKPEVTAAQIASLNAQFGAEIIDQPLRARNQYRLRLLDPNMQRTLEVANAYHLSNLVEWAEPNFIMQVTPDLQEFEWHLFNHPTRYQAGVTPGVENEDCRGLAANTIARGSANVAIAILDTGVELPNRAVPGDTGHPGLRNLMVDLARNFVATGSGTPDPDVDPSGTSGHGTCCAGVAAGSGGLTDGVAPGCRILPVKIMSVTTTPDGPESDITNNLLADAMHYASQHAQVLSNSYSSTRTNAVQQATQDILTNGREGKGTVVVFSAGNANHAIDTDSIKRMPGIMVIGASTNVGSRAGYSNFAESRENAPAEKRITVLAPSSGNRTDNSTERIYTTDMRGAAGFNQGTSPDRAGNLDYTARFGGTSSATPLVAGICALMLSVNTNLTLAQVRFILEATADKIGTGSPRAGVPNGIVPAGQEAHYDAATGHDRSFGFGRVNAEKAVKASRGDALPQLAQPVTGTGAPAIADAIPVVLTRVLGTNHFVSNKVIELVDARRDPQALNTPDRIFVRGGPGGFLRATFQPAGGGPSMSDEVDIQGTPA